MTLPTGKGGEQPRLSRTSSHKPDPGGDPTSTEHGNAQAVRAEGGCPTKPGCSGKRRDGREGVEDRYMPHRTAGVTRTAEWPGRARAEETKAPG